MIDPNYEGEMAVIVIEDEQGNETYYEIDMVIPHDGKEFACLVEIPGEECGEGCACHAEPDMIIARIERNGEEEEYVAPTDEEFNAVVARYEEIYGEE